MKRAFLFGLTAQLILIGALFLFFDDLMLPMTRSPAIGIAAWCLSVASGYLAWNAPSHPSWPVTVGLWIVGFLVIYVIVIPVIELVLVLTVALIGR